MNFKTFIQQQFHTGSRVIGDSTEKSDYDYVCTLDELRKYFPDKAEDAAKLALIKILNEEKKRGNK